MIARLISLSYALTHGFGYTRSLEPGLYIPHVTWPPGFPLLLAPVTAFSSLPINWVFIKAYMIAIGLAGVVLAWFYVRRLTGNRIVADIAAALLALLPFYWLFSRIAMTDGATVAFILLALIFIDLAWAQRPPRTAHVILAGLFSGLGMLLRGTNLCLIVVPLAYAVGARKAVTRPPRFVALLALHAVAFSFPTLVWAARNASIDTHGLGMDGVNEFRMLVLSDWLDPNSVFGPAEFLQKAMQNLVWHAIYRMPEQLIPGLWNAEWWTWTGAPFAAVGLSLVVALIALPRSNKGLPLALVIAPYAAFLSIWPEGGAVRCWIPVTSLLILLIVINWGWVLQRLNRPARLVLVVGMMAAYSANLAVFAAGFEARPYGGDLGDMVALFDGVRNLSDPPLAVDVHHSDLFTLRTGLAAPITVAERGIEPIYTHVILRDTKNAVGFLQKPPAGAVLLLRRGRWGYYALPQPMSEREMNSTEPAIDDSVN